MADNGGQSLRECAGEGRNRATDGGGPEAVGSSALMTGFPADAERRQGSGRRGTRDHSTNDGGRSEVGPQKGNRGGRGWRLRKNPKEDERPREKVRDWRVGEPERGGERNWGKKGAEVYGEQPGEV